MPPEDRIRLQHMRDAARTAQAFVQGYARADLDNDQKLLFAVVRALEIVGEAASRVSASTRATWPQVPWQPMIGMRNRMVHAYFDIDHEVVWQTVQSELPALLVVLEQVLVSKG